MISLPAVPSYFSYKNQGLWVFMGLTVLFLPTYWTLSHTIWLSEDQSQGMIVLGVVLFLTWQNKERLLKHKVLATQKIRTLEGWIGIGLFSLGLFLYLLGRSQDILFFEVGAQIFILMGLLVLFFGAAALKIMWFPLFFMLFMLPLPSPVVDSLTAPMKLAVSYVAESILYALDYPIAREGVIIQIGFYKLLVADACAGLHTLFSLEAMGMLYLYLVKHSSWTRNVFLGLLIIPISFVANVIRVIILVLVTYYWGDDVGQGFIHEFAGMVLFMTALLLIVGVDWTIHRLEAIFKTKSTASHAMPKAAG